MAEYTEECCFNEPRDCCPGPQCPCKCHDVKRVTRREWETLKIADFERLEAKVSSLETLLARAYPFLTWPDEVRGADSALDAEFDGIVTDVEVAIQHLPDDKEH